MQDQLESGQSPGYVACLWVDRLLLRGVEPAIPVPTCMAIGTHVRVGPNGEQNRSVRQKLGGVALLKPE